MSDLISAGEFYLAMFFSELPSISNKTSSPNYGSSRHSYLNITWKDFWRNYCKKKNPRKESTKLHENYLHRKIGDSSVISGYDSKMPNISPEMQNGPIKGSNTAGFTL